MCVKAYLHHHPVRRVPHPARNVLSVTGAAQAAVLHLLLLQLHDFLERDALQGSVSWNGVTDIFVWLPRVLRRQKIKGRIRNAAGRNSKNEEILSYFFTTKMKKQSFLLLKSALQSS